MSNNYDVVASMAQDFFDQRTYRELISDTGSPAGSDSRLQNLLDYQASELDGALYGRWPIPPRIPAGLPGAGTIPPILQKWIIVSTVARVYGRRADKPKGLDVDIEWCKEFIKGLIEGRISIPFVDRSNVPQLIDSESLTGHSRFSNVPYFDQGPTPTATDGKGLGNTPALPPTGW